MIGRMNENAIWDMPKPSENARPCDHCELKPHLPQYVLIDFSGDDEMRAFCSADCRKQFLEKKIVECMKPCGCEWANGPCVLLKDHNAEGHYCEVCIQP